MPRVGEARAGLRPAAHRDPADQARPVRVDRSIDIVDSLRNERPAWEHVPVNRPVPARRAAMPIVAAGAALVLPPLPYRAVDSHSMN